MKLRMEEQVKKYKSVSCATDWFGGIVTETASRMLKGVTLVEDGRYKHRSYGGFINRKRFDETHAGDDSLKKKRI